MSNVRKYLMANFFYCLSDKCANKHPALWIVLFRLLPLYIVFMATITTIGLFTPFLGIEAIKWWSICRGFAIALPLCFTGFFVLAWGLCQDISAGWDEPQL